MAILIRWCCLAVLLMLPAPVTAAGNLQLHEQEIKAGLLYNFLKYTDWIPEKTNNTPITVCIFGDDPFDGYLNPMAGRTVNQREITLRTVRSIQETATCHLLFINANEKSRWPQIVKFLAGKNVLTVSDFSGFADAGGMIEFGHKNEHISAEINLDAVNNAQLQVQDRLLKLVTVVHQGGR